MSAKGDRTSGSGESTIEVTSVEGDKIRIQKIDIEGVRDVRRSGSFLAAVGPTDEIIDMGIPSGANTCISIRGGKEHYVKEELRDLLR